LALETATREDTFDDWRRQSQLSLAAEPLEHIEVDGKHFKAGDKRFAFSGVTYGTFAKRADGALFPENAQVRADMKAIAAAGFTVVRTYTAPPMDMLDSARDFGLFSGKTQFFTHGLDLAKMGSLKDSLPPNTMGTVWYPFYAINSAKSKAFTAEFEKRMKTYPNGSAAVGYVAGKMLVEGIRKAGTDDVDAVRKALDTVQFEGPTGPTKIRACDHMALYNFYVGDVKRDASLPDGIGMTNVQAINTETVARSCDEVKKARASGG
jgi:hypothetical protein